MKENRISFSCATSNATKSTCFRRYNHIPVNSNRGELYSVTQQTTIQDLAAFYPDGYFNFYNKILVNIKVV